MICGIDPIPRKLIPVVGVTGSALHDRGGVSP